MHVFCVRAWKCVCVCVCAHSRGFGFMNRQRSQAASLRCGIHRSICFDPCPRSLCLSALTPHPPALWSLRHTCRTSPTLRHSSQRVSANTNTPLTKTSVLLFPTVHEAAACVQRGGLRLFPGPGIHSHPPPTAYRRGIMRRPGGDLDLSINHALFPECRFVN